MGLSVNRNNNEAVDVNSHCSDQMDHILGAEHSLDEHDTFDDDQNKQDADPADSTRLNRTGDNRLESVL